MGNLEPRLENTFAQAMEIADANTCAAFIARACGGDQTLRQEVEALVEADRGAGHCMKATQVVGPANANPSEQAGDRIGRYKLLEPIGEGGFGAVWMAVGFSTALALTLVIGTILSAWQAVRARQSSREADDQRTAATNATARAIESLAETKRARERAERHLTGGGSPPSIGVAKCESEISMSQILTSRNNRTGTLDSRCRATIARRPGGMTGWRLRIGYSTWSDRRCWPAPRLGGPESLLTAPGCLMAPTSGALPTAHSFDAGVKPKRPHCEYWILSATTAELS